MRNAPRSIDVNVASMTLSWPKLLFSLTILLADNVAAQNASFQAPPSETVTWIAAPVSAPPHSHRAVVRLTAAIRDGWHVYAIKQSADGPTPLTVAVDPNPFAAAAGLPAGSEPTVALEPAFGFATPYYTRSFTLTVPIRLLAAGSGTIPLRVRYQSCDGTICEPPKTVHLVAALGGAGGA